MADDADMRNELADLQTRADQIADEVQSKTRTHMHLTKRACTQTPPVTTLI